MIDSYRFLIRLQWSDERFLSEIEAVSSEALAIDESAGETLPIDTSVVEDSALNEHTEPRKPEIEEICVANETAFKILYTAEMDPATEVADIPEDIRHSEEAALKPASRKPASSANIYVTKNVASLLKNAGISKRSTVAATKRKHPETKIVSNSPPKRPKEYCDLDMSNVALPQFVISSKKFVTQNNHLDGTDVIDDGTTDTKTAVRTLDVNMVQLTGSDAENLNFDCIQPVHQTDEDNGTSMYACKYCPKAFSTSYHLILHSRKSHVCQFCLKGFPKVAELHRHVKETHNEFECPFCDRVFVCNSNLRAHIRRTHNVRLPANVSLMTLDKKANP